MATSSRVIAGLLAAAVMSLVIISCKDGPNNAVPPDPPECLEAVPRKLQSDTLAEFQWCAPKDASGITGYRVWWFRTELDRVDSFDIDAVHHSQWIGPVSAGRSYRLAIAARRGDLFSRTVSIDWSI
jgi:hypothetical protein